MTYNYLLPVNFRLLLFPADLCCDWTMGTIPVIQSIVDYRNLVTLGFYVVFGKVVYFALCKQGRLNRALIMVIIQYKLLRINFFYTSPPLICVNAILTRTKISSIKFPQFLGDLIGSVIIFCFFFFSKWVVIKRVK